LSVINCWLHAGAQDEAAALLPEDAAAQAMAWDGPEASKVAMSGEVRLSDEASKIEQLTIDKMKVALACLRRWMYCRSTPGSNGLLEIQ
jgi:hypothetical protein